MDDDAVLGARDAGLVAEALVHEERDDPREDRPDEQVEPGLPVPERRQEHVEHGTERGVEGVHRRGGGSYEM